MIRFEKVSKSFDINGTDTVIIDDIDLSIDRKSVV